MLRIVKSIAFVEIGSLFSSTNKNIYKYCIINLYFISLIS